MAVQTSARAASDGTGRDFQVARDDHDPITCPCCQRAEAIANAHVEHIVLVEHERDEARADCRVYRELLQQSLGQLHSLTVTYRRVRDERDRFRDELRGLRREAA